MKESLVNDVVKGMTPAEFAEEEQRVADQMHNAPTPHSERRLGRLLESLLTAGQRHKKLSKVGTKK